ncbi:hypothetical protein G6F32_016525 [Rhizopus arrhizus]|nr:hypothetical protein G6F32_016525 [Rhizopus arrhizus]
MTRGSQHGSKPALWRRRPDYAWLPGHLRRQGAEPAPGHQRRQWHAPGCFEVRPAGVAYHRARPGIEGAELGIVQGQGESFPSFKARVIAAAGLSEADKARARADLGVHI